MKIDHEDFLPIFDSILPFQEYLQTSKAKFITCGTPECPKAGWKNGKQVVVSDDNCTCKKPIHNVYFTQQCCMCDEKFVSINELNDDCPCCEL